MIKTAIYTPPQKSKIKFWALSMSVITGLFMLATVSLVSASSLSIQPLRQELGINPGQALSSFVVVRNTGPEPATMNISAETFNVINENYDYSFAQDQDLAKWIRFDEQKTVIMPNQSFKFNFTINAPISAEPGGKYFVIFGTISKKSTANIDSIERVGGLIYLSVSGNSTRTGSTIGLSVPKISSNSKLDWNMRIHNTGTVHFKSTITTKTSHWPFGSVKIQSADHLILPNTIRLIKNSQNLGKMIGLYKIQISAGMGDAPTENQTRWVLYLPPLQSALFVITILLGYIAVAKSRNKKSHKT